MRWVVLGAGAIGAGLGGLLHEAGAEVVLVARGAHGDVMRAHGLELRTPTGARRVSVRCRVEHDWQEGDVAVVATMAHDTGPALHGVPTGVPVVSWQNGLDAPEDIAAAGYAVCPCVVYVPAERRAPGVVVLDGVPVVGTLLVGGQGVVAAPLVAALARCGLGAEVEPDIAPWQRAKVLANLGGLPAALCDDVPADVVEAARGEAIAAWAASGTRYRTLVELMERVGPLSTVSVDGIVRRGGSTRAALARRAPLESVGLHGRIVREAEGRAPVNAALAALAARGGWVPGAMSANELRVAVGVGGRG